MSRRRGWPADSHTNRPGRRAAVHGGNCLLKTSPPGVLEWSPARAPTFFTRFFLMTLRILFCCSISREMLRGRSSLSTTPAGVGERWCKQ